MITPGFSLDLLVATLARTEVKWMSTELLGVPYEQLKALIYPRPPYKQFIIRKRDGTPRILAEPRLKLKLVQTRVLKFLEKHAGPFKPSVHGFVRHKSILTNARQHCSSRTHHLLNLDLENFFPSITFYRVRGVFQKHPFNCSYEVATVLAHVCTLDGTLPQGAPTSPFLANLVCRSMDRDLANLARRYRAIYTRYADDITFSFNIKNVERLPAAICSIAERQVILGPELCDIIINRHHFSINPLKTRLQNKFHRMEVTGLTINEFPNVRRRFIDQIRGALHAWEKYGYDAAQEAWERRIFESPSVDYEKRAWKRQTRTGVPPSLKNIVWGKLLYIRMVRGKDDTLYARLAERYNAVVEAERVSGAFTASSLPVEPVVRNHQSAEDAVFVVEWWGDYQSNPGKSDDVVMAQGTAFAYKKLNLLVTCDHVFQAKATVGSMLVPTDYSEPEVVDKTLQLVHPVSRQAWPAKVLYRNAQLDIALVAFEDSEIPPHRYFSAMESPIGAREPGVLIGFPDYKNWNRPDFVELKVVNRTEPNKGMLSFTITGAGSVRPGNSGGPFVDERFRVAGVAQRGAHMGTGHDECLCFTLLDSCVSRWEEARGREL